MSELSSIGVRIENDALRTGNVRPLLNEIRHALTHLLESGEAGIIDLRGIPLGPGEEEMLEQALGEGEVHATLTALGPSEIRESAYPGVWVVTHYNQDEEIIGKFVEITTIPELLLSQPEDMADGLQRLRDRLRDDPAQ
jgi:hydrogenase-1 operon protein HyaF